MGFPWPDQVRRGDKILASHITTLRNEIKHQGDLAGLNPPITWNPATINPGDSILAVHFRDMRSAIQRLWNSKHRGPLPMWTSGVNPGGASLGTTATALRASDITDLRHWLDIYIDNHPRTGMDTKSYDAEALNRPHVDSNLPNPWIPNISALMPPPPSLFMVRCKAASPVRYPNAPETSGSENIAWSDTDRDHYGSAFSAIRSPSGAGAAVYAVLTREFVRYEADPNNINQPLDSNFTNSFITAYANQAALFASRIINSGVSAFIIWNEPNGTQGGVIAADKFAALIYNCYKCIKNVSPDVLVICGGILMAPNPLNQNLVNQGEIDYWSSLYESVSDFRPNGVRIPLFFNGQEITANGPWPWDAVNFHIHRTRTPEYLEDLRKKILDESISTRNNNNAAKIVGECGITQDQFDAGVRLTSGDPNNPLMFDRLISMFDLVCQFSHHQHFESGEGTWGVQQYDEDPPVDQFGNPDYSNRSRVGRYKNHTNAANVQAFWDHLKLSFTRLTS